MEEMVYSRNNIRKVLAHERYKGYEFVILNLGTHPTAYVNVPVGHPAYGKNYNELDIYVHGGLTYGSDYLVIDTDELNGWWIGWDYAHYDDYHGFETSLPVYLRDHGKKWTTGEILSDVVDVIEQLIAMEGK